VLTVACSDQLAGGDSIDEAGFKARLLDESAITEEQAACISERTFNRITPEAIALIVNVGPWAAGGQAATEYAWISTACLTAFPATPDGDEAAARP
jgi:hypothetical protein